jgi:hypothetical protein
MCFLDNKITPEFSAREEIDQVFSAKDTNFCPFCKKTIAGPRIALVVHFAMVHTERSLLECSKFLLSSESSRFIAARNRRIDALLTVTY